MALYVDPTIPRFTRAELVAEMSSSFGDFGDGAFRRWQELGLVAAPRRSRRSPKGRGSSKGLWSDGDRQMLAYLLGIRNTFRQRYEGQLNLWRLAPVVVWSWVFEEGSPVALDQAQRALRTDCRSHLGGADGAARSRERMFRSAMAAVNRLAAPGMTASDKKVLATKLTDLVWTGDVDGLTTLAPAMEAIATPTRSGPRRDSHGPLPDDLVYLEVIALRGLGTRAVVTRDPRLQANDWLAARHLVRQTWNTIERRRTLNLLPPSPLDVGFHECSSALVQALAQRMKNRRAADGPDVPSTAR